MKALGLAALGAAVRPPKLARGTSAAVGAAGTCTAGGLIGREPDVVAIHMHGVWSLCTCGGNGGVGVAAELRQRPADGAVVQRM